MRDGEGVEGEVQGEGLLPVVGGKECKGICRIEEGKGRPIEELTWVGVWRRIVFLVEVVCFSWLSFMVVVVVRNEGSGGRRGDGGGGGVVVLILVDGG